ncbi:MAG: filamentous hemagglutinin N-terminal domain-containing protein, partial [Janthinobacterium lividum]
MRASLLAGSVILVAGASEAQALPTGGSVAAGSATITAVTSQLTVRQSTQNAVINWQSFGIGRGEGVTFVQPNSNSVALNRVVGQVPTAILGSLTANGKVFVVNPNGVLFGQGAQVNVAGLVASTLGIADSDFMAGRYSFSGSGGSVVNRGTIVADGGYVVLLGANVSNTGLISARLGSVALAAGTAATLDVGGTGLLTVTVDRGAVDALADNGGMIVADGGNVVMTARGASGLLKTAVNNSGVIQARSIGTRNGSIMLLGDAANGVVEVGGTLDASGAAAATTGGAIVATGNAVDITGTVDASGSAGG